MNIIKVKQRLNILEGRKSHLYKDSYGYNTIGVGHNLDANGISDAVIDLILDEDCNETEKDLNYSLSWWLSLDEVRQAALFDMCFELGISSLLKFTTFLGLMQSNEFDRAADDLKTTLYYKQVPNRAKENEYMIRTGNDAASNS